MDNKGSDSSYTSSQYLKTLNKLSHSISKPVIQSSKKIQLQSQSQSQPQPPVYNINKNDFRDVVQKLTGSPALDRLSTPPPIQPSVKSPSSRLQRIRPPPLPQLSSRPSPPISNSGSAMPLNPPLPAAAVTNSFVQRPSPSPVSPFPPFSAVIGAAESPVSAYMRHLQNSIFSGDSAQQFSGFSPLPPPVSPRWNNLAPPHQPPPNPPVQDNQQPMAPSQPQFQFPTSPLPFWGLSSPRSPHPLFSPGLLLSPSAFPLSPTWPMPSPGWRGL